MQMLRFPDHSLAYNAQEVMGRLLLQKPKITVDVVKQVK